MSNSTPFENLKVGVNPSVLVKLLDDWSKEASNADLLAASDMGIPHWPYLAASAEHGGWGVLNLTMDRKEGKEDRTYAVAPFPVGSIPKALRPAFTSPYPGEVLIDLDWRASHWQILAFRAGDDTLIQDLRSGDLYSSLFPEVDRPKAKAGLNTVLNGGGKKSLEETLGGGEAATDFLAKVHELLDTRWARAGAMVKKLRAEAVSQGWVTEERAYGGAGIALMRIEAANLRRVFESSKLKELGLKPVLPLHDGVLASAPKEVAEELALKAAKVMTALSTGSAEEAREHSGTWVKWEISTSWRGNNPQLLGHDLRAAALKACTSSAKADLVLAAAVMPQELEAVRKSRNGNSIEAKAIRAAFAAHQAAAQWVKGSLSRKAEATEESAHPLVELPHGDSTYTNITRILQGDKNLPELRWNARESCITLGGVEADDTVLRRTYLPHFENRYGMGRVAASDFMGAVTDAARDCEFDPVKDYFSNLSWDGNYRISTWLQDYAGAQELAESSAGAGLVRVYGVKWMLSIVARAFQPGCKVDTMLVLMGDQGARKSSLLRAIAPAGSFSEVKIDPDDKDSVLRASRYAVVEWPELAGAGRREQEALKAYFTLQEDRVRPPYARGDLRIPRRTVFAATTNLDDFLRDATGSRRYWPVKVEEIDIDGIIAVRDQLWAEAVDLYRFILANPNAPDADCIWWLNPSQDAERARQAAHFTAEDPLRDKIWDFVIKERGRVTLEGVLDHLEVKPVERPRITTQVTSALKALGLVSKTVREGGRIVRRWVHPGPFPSPLGAEGILADYN